MIELVFTKGPMTGVRFAVESESVSVGRHNECDIELAQSNVSRVHAIIRRTATGAQILDNKSGNGTFVNGSRVRSADLKDGDEIRIGANTIRIEIRAEQDDALDSFTRRARNGEKQTRLDTISRFILVNHPRKGERIELSADKLPMGRGDKCKLTLKDVEVSRLHATIFHRNGVFTLRDEGSANGTYCDNERIIEIQLGATNVIELGNTILFTSLTDGVLTVEVSSKAAATGKGSGSASFETIRSAALPEKAEARKAARRESKPSVKPRKKADDSQASAVSELPRQHYSPSRFPIVRVLATVIAVAVMLMIVGRMYAATANPVSQFSTGCAETARKFMSPVIGS